MVREWIRNSQRKQAVGRRPSLCTFNDSFNGGLTMKDFWKFLVGMVLAMFFVTPDTEDKVVVDEGPVPPIVVPDVVPEPEPFVPPSQICQCSPDCTCGCEAGTGESCSCGNSSDPELSTDSSVNAFESDGCVVLSDGTVVCPPASGSNQSVMSSSSWGTQSTSGRVYRRRGLFGGFFRR